MRVCTLRIVRAVAVTDWLIRHERGAQCTARRLSLFRPTRKVERRPRRMRLFFLSCPDNAGRHCHRPADTILALTQARLCNRVNDKTAARSALYSRRLAPWVALLARSLSARAIRRGDISIFRSWFRESCRYFFSLFLSPSLWRKESFQRITVILYIDDAIEILASRNLNFEI